MFNHAQFIWSVADTLRGAYKQHQYGDVILPFTVLARLDAVLAPTKDAVLAAVYLGDLEASDEYKVGSLKLLTDHIAADSTLQQQYRNNTAIDFLHSPALVEVSEDALWSHETQTDEIIKRLRELPDQARIQLLVDVGLLDALEQA